MCAGVLPADGSGHTPLMWNGLSVVLSAQLRANIVQEVQLSPSSASVAPKLRSHSLFLLVVCAASRLTQLAESNLERELTLSLNTSDQKDYQTFGTQ